MGWSQGVEWNVRHTPPTWGAHVLGNHGSSCIKQHRGSSRLASIMEELED
jgi:hypothetical protein